MTNTTKIVFIGATSMSFGLSMLRDIFSSNELRSSTLTLVGRNAQTLAKMTELARLLNAKSICARQHRHQAPSLKPSKHLFYINEAWRQLVKYFEHSVTRSVFRTLRAAAIANARRRSVGIQPANLVFNGQGRPPRGE